MLKCREVTHIVAGEADRGFWHRMELKMHLFMCVHCRRYASQIRALGRGARELAASDPTDPARLDEIETHVVDCCCEKDD